MSNLEESDNIFMNSAKFSFNVPMIMHQFRVRYLYEVYFIASLLGIKIFKYDYMIMFLFIISKFIANFSFPLIIYIKIIKIINLKLCCSN